MAIKLKQEQSPEREESKPAEQPATKPSLENSAEKPPEQPVVELDAASMSTSLEAAIEAAPQDEDNGESSDGDKNAKEPVKRGTILMSKVINAAGNHYKLILVIILIMLALPPGYNYVQYLYREQIREAGFTAYAEENYPKVINELTQYMKHSPENGESALILAKAFTHQRNYNHAEKVLGNYKKNYEGEDTNADWIEIELYLGLLDLLVGQIEQSEIHIRRVLVIQPDYLPGYYLLVLLKLYGEGDMERTLSAIDEGVAMSETVNAENLKQAAVVMNALRKIFFPVSPLVLEEQFPLPFDVSNEVVTRDADEFEEEDIGLILKNTGFNNFYYLPSNGSALVDETLGFYEQMQLLRAVIQLRQDNVEQAQVAMDDIKEQGQDTSLYYAYIKAYIEAKTGAYADAAELYREISGRDRSVDPMLMQATALWAANEGNAPTQEILDIYDNVLSAQSGNLIALGNLAYLNIYQSELEPARALLTKGYELAPANFDIIYNLAFVEALEGDLEKALDSFYALRANAPEDPAVLSALVRILLALGQVSDAIVELNALKKYDDSPALYQQIADIYREGSQPLLVVSELVTGRTKFPDNRDIMLDLLFEYAAQGDTKKYLALRDVADPFVLRTDYRAWLARAILTTKQNADQADSLFSEALGLASELNQKEEVLLLWLRSLVDQGDYLKALDIVAIGEEIYRDNKVPVPQQVDVIRIWGEAQISNEEKRKEMLAELILFENLALSPVEQTDIAQALIVLGDNGQAVAILESISSAYSAERMLNVLLQAYTNIGDTEKATSTQRRLDAIAQRSLLEAEEYTEAAANLREAGLAFSSSEESVLRSVGLDDEAVVAVGDDELTQQLNEAVKKKDYQEAISIYDQLLAADTKRFSPAIMHQNRGVLYLKINEYLKASDDFRQALDLSAEISDKDLVSVLYNYALSLIQAKNYEESRGALDRLLGVDPNNLRGLILYAQLLDKMLLYDQLPEVYNKILELSPQQIGVYINLSRAYRYSGDIDNAISTLQKALGINAKSEAVHRALASLYAVTGEHRKAQEHLTIIEGL